mmetsp:Transcript_27436/g.66741  ORF Transcript_27436/g.66741 Transcript_27436/m.66741 type:complete len:347 (+) Transcript_27436:206-1246(+)
MLRHARLDFLEGSEPHCLLCPGSCCSSNLVSPCCAVLQNVGEDFRILGDFIVLLPDRTELLHHGIRHERLKLAPAQFRDFAQELFHGPIRGGAVNVEEVRRLRPLGVVVLDTEERVRLASLDLVRYLLRCVEEVDSREIRRCRFAHLACPVLKRHDSRGALLDHGLGLLEDRPGSAPKLLRLVPLAVLVVEPPRDVPGELQVLLLVLSDRNQIGLVEQDVAGHEHRVVEEADADALPLLLRLLLELDHPLKPAEGRRAVEQPRQLRVGRHVRLHEDVRLGRVDAAGDVQGRGLHHRLLQLLRHVRGGDGVEVHDAEEVLVLVLVVNPLLDRAEVVPQVDRPGRLDA